MWRLVALSGLAGLPGDCSLVSPRMQVESDSWRGRRRSGRLTEAPIDAYAAFLRKQSLVQDPRLLCEQSDPWNRQGWIDRPR